MKRFLHYFSVLPVLIMLLLIFGFSSQDGETSDSLSFRVCCAILSFVDSIFSWSLSDQAFLSRAQSMQLFVRKTAHVTEYLLLTLSIFLPLRLWIVQKRPLHSLRDFLRSLLLPTCFLAVVCASLDEFHQSFVPGRCGTPLDVLVDSIGIIFGCIILIFCHRRIKNKCNK